MNKNIVLTTAPVQPGDFQKSDAEFGRTADVQRQYGLKRGSLYNLLLDGKVRGVLLRVRGKKSGVRLWDMGSIREFIRGEMELAQQPKN